MGFEKRDQQQTTKMAQPQIKQTNKTRELNLTKLNPKRQTHRQTLRLQLAIACINDSIYQMCYV